MEQRFRELLEMVRLERQAGFQHLSAGQHYLASPFQYGVARVYEQETSIRGETSDAYAVVE